MLVPAVGIAAFSLVVPITVAMLVVLAFLILSYRETIKAYPTAGGAYIVTSDNFGLMPAQVAGVTLLTDYVLTVAVSVAAQAGGGEARIVEERHVIGTNGEDQIEAIDDRGRHWYHRRPEPSRRMFLGLEPAWWMALGWPVLILLLFLPYPWWW